jgi:osmotically-inducible protein OsmY
MLFNMVLVLLFLMLLGVIPTWPHSKNWGYYPSGSLGVLLLILIFLMPAGRKIDEAAEQASHTVHQNLDRAKSSTQTDIQHVDTAVSDADITAKVKLALMMRDGINSLTISVTTRAGIVTLSGSVASAAQFQLAQELALAVDDVTHVDNRLAVVSAVQPINKAKP